MTHSSHRLKDSDVTWLYGPLHTAVEWTPPPKPKADPTSVDDKNPASAQDRLDLSIGLRGAKKPILKHRSICEFLTSDLPAGSPLLSSLANDGDRNVEEANDEMWVQDKDQDDTELLELTSDRDRPPLLHTKSDTHITRWPSRAFRRDSPPRIIAEEQSAGAVTTPSSTTSASSYLSGQTSSTMTQTYSQTSGSDQDPATAGASNGFGRKKHITFNTFVEQCIAIDKPDGNRDGPGSAINTPRNPQRVHDIGYDDGSVSCRLLYEGRSHSNDLKISLLGMTRILKAAHWRMRKTKNLLPLLAVLFQILQSLSIRRNISRRTPIPIQTMTKMKTKCLKFVRRQYDKGRALVAHIHRLRRAVLGLELQVYSRNVIV